MQYLPNTPSLYLVQAQTAFVAAAASGSCEAVSAAFHEHELMDANDADVAGMTALVAAAKYRHAEWSSSCLQPKLEGFTHFPVLTNPSTLLNSCIAVMTSPAAEQRHCTLQQAVVTQRSFKCCWTLEQTQSLPRLMGGPRFTALPKTAMLRWPGVC